MRFEDCTVAIVGLGLMGGSLALALAESGACRRIVGVNRGAGARSAAIQRGCVEAASADLSLAADADLIVLATPARTILRLLPQIGEIARPGAVVLDLGSTKREIVRAMSELPPHLQPIGGHPMCGRENGGFAAADAALYRDATFALTPLARTSPETMRLAESLVAAVGAKPLLLDPARHDRIVATISHLPFIMSSTLMGFAADRALTDDLLFRLAAGGFRDTTRVAAKDPTVMLDILMTNRDEVAAAARECARRLEEVADLIERGDETPLRVRLESAARSRQALFTARGGNNG